MKMPFGKNSHVDIIKPIAVGLHLAGALHRYLEIGIRRGPCFNAVAPLVSKEAYAVDINKECYNGIKHNKNLRWFHGKSQDFLKQHDPKKQFDLVFIDGDHKYTEVLNDFRGVFPLVRENGIILLHDTYPPSEEYTSSSYCFDAYKAADWIRTWNQKDDFQYRCEIVTLPFYFGVSVIRKTNKQLLWME